MKNIFFAMTALLMSHTAFASGGTHCVADNRDVKVEVSLGNGHYFGNPVLPGSSVTVKIKRGSIATGIVDYTFKKNDDVNEIPYWFNIGKDLKMAAYAEPEADADGNAIDAFVTIAVVIDAKANKSGDGYVGTYTVIQSTTTNDAGYVKKEFKGFIKCEVE